MTVPNLSDAALLSHATPNCSSTCSFTCIGMRSVHLTME
jgi:hypothetical protein